MKTILTNFAKQIENIPECFSTKEVAGLYFTNTNQISDLTIGKEHEVRAPIPPINENPIRWHTHPNDFNEMLFNENDVVDFPSGGDVMSDLYDYPPKDYCNAVLVPSRKHKQIGLFIYKISKETMKFYQEHQNLE